MEGMVEGRHWQVRGRCVCRLVVSLTVDGDGNAFVQDISVLANKGRDLGKLVELEILRTRVGRINLNSLDVEVVGLRNCEDGRRPGVGLFVERWLA